MNRPVNEIAAEIEAALCVIEAGAAHLVGTAESLTAEENAAYLHRQVKGFVRLLKEDCGGADLIAAGPELLAVVKEMAAGALRFHWLRVLPPDHKALVGRAIAAILNAEGESIEAGALRRALAASGLPHVQVIDDGTGFVCKVQEG